MFYAVRPGWITHQSNEPPLPKFSIKSKHGKMLQIPQHLETQK